MSEEESIKCINCKQYIAKSKMFLHEGFCLKNNKYCPECDKIFLIQEFEEHLKTHTVKKANPPQEKKPPKIQEKKVINQKEKSAISEHRKNCKHDKKEPVPKGSPKPERPKIKPRIIDDNLGVRRCEFCDNMVENLPEHLKECKVKKMIEEENAKYYKDLEKRNKEDDMLAKKLAKEKFMDVSKDEQMARQLQKELKPIVDTTKDELMARNLEKNLLPILDTSKDQQMARNLQRSLCPMVDTANDEQFARDLQRQLREININTSDDERLARELQNKYEISNNNQYGFNQPVYGQNDADDELKRAIEQSKKDFYK